MSYLDMLDNPPALTAEQVEAFRRERQDPPDGPIYVRAGTLRQCSRCHELEARGVILLHCSDCDVLTDCPACKRLGVVCGLHYFPDGEDPSTPPTRWNLDERGRIRKGPKP